MGLQRSLGTVRRIGGVMLGFVQAPLQMRIMGGRSPALDGVRQDKHFYHMPYVLLLRLHDSRLKSLWCLTLSAALCAGRASFYSQNLTTFLRAINLTLSSPSEKVCQGYDPADSELLQDSTGFCMVGAVPSPSKLGTLPPPTNPELRRGICYGDSGGTHAYPHKPHAWWMSDADTMDRILC